MNSSWERGDENYTTCPPRQQAQFPPYVFKRCDKDGKLNGSILGQRPTSSIQSGKREGKSMSNDKINVLDHGFIRLVESMGNDLSVVRAARVSYDAAWRAGDDTEGDRKLINYLWKYKHTSPFEAVQFTFEVHAPIFVFRQWHRHRTWSYNELSARYRPLPEVFYVPDPKYVGEQDSVNKQGRFLGKEEFKEKRLEESGELINSCKASFKTYNWLLERGWPRELARSVLPLNTYSHMFASVNLLNLLKFMTLRSDSHAQYEIQVYSNAMHELVRPIVPVCIAAWEKTFQKD